MPQAEVNESRGTALESSSPDFSRCSSKHCMAARSSGSRSPPSIPTRDFVAAPVAATCRHRHRAHAPNSFNAHRTQHTDYRVTAAFGQALPWPRLWPRRYPQRPACFKTLQGPGQLSNMVPKARGLPRAAFTISVLSGKAAGIVVSLPSASCTLHEVSPLLTTATKLKLLPTCGH